MFAFKYHSLAGIVVATSLSVVGSAQSATVITGGPAGSPSGIYASAVDNLVVGSVTYDVKFRTEGDTTFEGDATGANAAANALAAALNGSAAIYIQDATTPSDIFGGFDVQTQINGGDVVFYNLVADAWENAGGPGTATGEEIANFTVVNATPLPGALPLFATVLGGMGVFGWRKRRKDVAAMAVA
jgi:hypothetical protein